MVLLIDNLGCAIPRQHQNAWLAGGFVRTQEGINGRSGGIRNENRTWRILIDFAAIWTPELVARFIILGDRNFGGASYLRLHLCNGRFSPKVDEAALYADLGVPSEYVKQGWIPYNDQVGFSDGSGFALPPLATVGADALAGARTIAITGDVGATLMPAAFFSIDGFLYRVESNSSGTVTFNPPLRQDVMAGEAVDWKCPGVIVRAPDYTFFTDFLKFGRGPSVEFIEAFER